MLGNRSKLALIAIALAIVAVAGCIGSVDEDPRVDTQTEPSQDPPSPNTSNRTAFPDFSQLGDQSIRPGVPIVSTTSRTGENTTACTANFLFRDAENRSLFLGTAAHCTDEMEIGSQVSIGRDGRTRGELVYNSYRRMDNLSERPDGWSKYNDLALVELPTGAWPDVHPAMLGYGGPTGLSGSLDIGAEVFNYGNTRYREHAPNDEQLDRRRGIVTHETPWVTWVRFPNQALPGDSGAPVVSADGEAVGEVSRYNVLLARYDPDEVPPVDDPQTTASTGAMGIGRLQPQIAWAENHTDLDVELVTWSDFEPGGLP